jgi:hypothetical protein
MIRRVARGRPVKFSGKNTPIGGNHRLPFSGIFHAADTKFFGNVAPLLSGGDSHSFGVFRLGGHHPIIASQV